MGYIDLHVHSKISDGTLSPHELVRYAAAHNVTTFALTDHDSVYGIDEALSEAARCTEEGNVITCIPGIEISAAYKDRDIHILGLLINHHNTELNNLIKFAMLERNKRNERMATLFREFGIPITLDGLRGSDVNATITRAHFAKYLIDNGYVRSNTEAFDRYLGFSCPFYVPRTYVKPENAIKAILAAGGIPVLAHPLLYKLRYSDLEFLVSSLKDSGLSGLEVYYSSNVNNDEDLLRHLALNYDLLMTGGSDFHGTNKQQLEIGIGRGNLSVPESVLFNLYKLKNSKYPRSKESATRILSPDEFV